MHEPACLIKNRTLPDPGMRSDNARSLHILLRECRDVPVIVLIGRLCKKRPENPGGTLCLLSGNPRPVFADLLVSGEIPDKMFGLLKAFFHEHFVSHIRKRSCDCNGLATLHNRYLIDLY